MLFNASSCAFVMYLFNRDDDRSLDKMMELVEAFQMKYNCRGDNHLASDKRKDTKLLFNVLEKGIANDEVLREIEEDMKEGIEDTYAQDRVAYKKFIMNVREVLKNIDYVNIHQPDDAFQSSYNYCFYFLYHKGRK